VRQRGAADQTLDMQNPPKRRAATDDVTGKKICGGSSFPDITELRKWIFLPQARCVRGEPLPGRVEHTREEACAYHHRESPPSTPRQDLRTRTGASHGRQRQGPCLGRFIETVLSNELIKEFEEEPQAATDYLDLALPWQVWLKRWADVAT
jgi:hypothetical protein